MWNEEEYSPVLIFKPRGEAIQIGPVNLIGKHKDATFIFRFPTKTQKDVMLRAKDNMLFLDATHKTNEEDLQLLNVLAVADDRGYPSRARACYLQLLKGMENLNLLSTMRKHPLIFFKLIKILMGSDQCSNCTSSGS